MATTQPTPSVSSSGSELTPPGDQSMSSPPSKSSQAPSASSRRSGPRRAPRNLRKEKRYKTPRSVEGAPNEPETGSTREVPFPVFMIYSNWSLKNIQECLSNLGNGNVGPLHIDRDRNGEETNRTIGLLDESVYNGAVEAGYTGNSQLSISRYQLRKNSYPSREQAYSFFIPLPKNFNLSELECRQQLETRFNQFIAFQLLKAGDFKISVPLVSRDTDHTRGFCFVSFKRSVDHDTIAITKVLLDNTWWFAASPVAGEHWRELLRCYWAKSRQNRPRDESLSGRPNRAERDDRTEKPMTRSQQPTQASLAPVACSMCQSSPCACASDVCMASAPSVSDASLSACANAACHCKNCQCNPCRCTSQCKNCQCKNCQCDPCECD